MYSAAADAVVVLHFLFVLFVAFGGLLVLRWPRTAWVHLPSAAWGIGIEFGGWICPLTPLENRLRELGGVAAYRGDFLARYLMPVLYPEGLTRDAQIILGVAGLAGNAAIYAYVVRRRHRRIRKGSR